MQERDFPSKNKPRFKRKQSGLLIKFLLICQGLRGRRGASRVMDACPSSCEVCVCVYLRTSVCPCATTCLKGASYSISLRFDTSLMHPVLEFQSSNVQHPLPPNTRPSHMPPHTAGSKLNVSPHCFSHFTFLLCVSLKAEPKDLHRVSISIPFH